MAIGFTGRYYSYMTNIDNFLTSSVETIMNSGIKEYRAAHNKGNFIVDVRVSYNYHDFKFYFLVNNFFNTEYSLRPITIEAHRTTSLQVLLHI